MTSFDTTRIRLSDAAQLISALPSLIGFHPVESLVLTCLHRRRIGLTMRVDLPTTPEHWDLLVEQLLPPLITTDPSVLLLTVVSDPGVADIEQGLPHTDFVDFVIEALADEGIRVAEAQWAESTAGGARWARYDWVPGCVGTVPDPTASTVAAATVAEGRVVFADREELEGLLTPDNAEVLARREVLLNRRDEEHPYTVKRAQDRFHEMGRLLGPARAGLLYLDDERVASAGSALLDLRVRDACLTWSLGEDAEAAERLWTALVRGLPGSHRADPAVLLAATAYLRGDGALAGIALDVALEAWPGHSFASLLRSALSNGVAPGKLREAMKDAEADAVLELGLGREKAS